MSPATDNDDQRSTSSSSDSEIHRIFANVTDQALQCNIDHDQPLLVQVDPGGNLGLATRPLYHQQASRYSNYSRNHYGNFISILTGIWRSGC